MLLVYQKYQTFRRYDNVVNYNVFDKLFIDKESCFILCLELLLEIQLHNNGNMECRPPYMPCQF